MRGPFPKLRSRARETLTFGRELCKALTPETPNSVMYQNRTQKHTFAARPAEPLEITETHQIGRARQSSPKPTRAGLTRASHRISFSGKNVLRALAKKGSVSRATGNPLGFSLNMCNSYTKTSCHVYKHILAGRAIPADWC